MKKLHFDIEAILNNRTTFKYSHHHITSRKIIMWQLLIRLKLTLSMFFHKMQSVQFADRFKKTELVLNLPLNI